MKINGFVRLKAAFDPATGVVHYVVGIETASHEFIPMSEGIDPDVAVWVMFRGEFKEHLDRLSMLIAKIKPEDANTQDPATLNKLMSVAAEVMGTLKPLCELHDDMPKRVEKLLEAARASVAEQQQRPKLAVVRGGQVKEV